MPLQSGPWTSTQAAARETHCLLHFKGPPWQGLLDQAGERQTGAPALACGEEFAEDAEDSNF